MADLEMVKLPKSGMRTTRVGFGCSNLLGDKTRKDGLALLQAAYEAGVRHFDVARVYNFGDAEAIVGEFVRGKRDQVTITTKFGKAPRAGVARMRGPVQAVRRLMRGSPWVRRLIRRNVSALTQTSQFVPALARGSLEASLRALKTDYVDLFLLHEGVETDCTDDMLSFLHQVRREGKVNAFGCGSAYQAVEGIAQNRPDFLQVAQFESNLQKRNREAFQAILPRENELIITHGALACAREIHAKILSDPKAEKRWREIVGVDLSEVTTFCGFLLRYALDVNAGGQVLFRASTPERTRATLAALHRLPTMAAVMEVIRTSLQNSSSAGQQ